MAYILKTTGIAAKLISCVGVDQDGTTVKDFVTGKTGTYNASIAAPKTGVGAWKSTARSWFKTDIGADIYTPRGWVWSSLTAAPMGAGGNGITSIVMAHSMDAAGTGIFWLLSDGNQGMRRSAAGKMEVYCGATVRGTGITTLAATTKLTFGFSQVYAGATLPMYFGLESGTLAEDGTYAEGSYASTANLAEFGGHTAYGSAPGQYYLDLKFSAAALPTTAELQALHLDPWGTLFEPPFASTTQTGAGLITLTTTAAQEYHKPSVQTGTGLVTLTTAASQSYNISIRQARTAPEALVYVYGALAGTPRASQTGLRWFWQDTWAGAVLDSGAGASLDINAFLVVNIPNTGRSNGQYGYLTVEIPDVNPAITWPRQILYLPVTVA